MGPSLTPLLLLVVAIARAAQLPSSMKTCKQTDPDFNGCLKKAVQDAVPTLIKGIPSLGLPPLDPLHFTQIKIQDTPERPVTLNLEFNEVDVTGISNSIVEWIEMKPGSYHLKGKAHADGTFSLVGSYRADGKVLVLPIKGQGHCNITSPRVEALVDISGQPVERDGETYWDVTDLKTDTKLHSLSVDLTGLFDNNKALAETTLKFMNENSAEIAKDLKPAIDEALGVSYKEIARKIFENVPYNSVFPPS